MLVKGYSVSGYRLSSNGSLVKAAVQAPCRVVLGRKIAFGTPSAKAVIVFCKPFHFFAGDAATGFKGFFEKPLRKPVVCCGKAFLKIEAPGTTVGDPFCKGLKPCLIQLETRCQKNDRRQLFPGIKIPVEPARDQAVVKRAAILEIPKQFGLAIMLIRVDEARQLRFVECTS